jgi:hypothetical protein
MDRIAAVVNQGWQFFRRLPLLAQFVAWAGVGALLALVAFSLDDDSAKTSRVATRVPGVHRAPQGAVYDRGKSKPGQADPQLPARTLPREVGDYEPPEDFRATTASVRRLFQKTLGGRGRPGLNANTLVGVKCGRGKCVIKYIVDGPGGGRILESQGALWRGLVKDEHFKEGTIIAYPGGPDLRDVTGKRKQEGPPEGAGAPVFKITCSRDAILTVGAAWGVQGSPRVRASCKTEEGPELPGA